MRRAQQPVVDRLAQPVVRDGGDRDAGDSRRVDLVQQAEQAGGGLDQVSRGGERPGPVGVKRAEAEIGLAFARGIRVEAKLGMGRVMAQELARRMGAGGMGFHRYGVAQHLLDLGPRHAAVAEQLGAILEKADDARLHAHLAAPAVEHHRHLVLEVAAHVLRRGGADLARGVGAGRHHRAARGPEQVEAPPGGGNADGDRVEAGTGQQRDRGRSGARGTTRLKGPGQKAAASALASGLKLPSAKAAPASGTWAMSGLKEGLPLAA